MWLVKKTSEGYRIWQGDDVSPHIYGTYKSAERDARDRNIIEEYERVQSKWRVSTQYFGDKQVWQVCRLRNVHEVDHAGNREYTPDVFYTHEEAEAKADEMNKD